MNIKQINDLLNKAAVFERFNLHESALKVALAAVQGLEQPLADESVQRYDQMRLIAWTSAGNLHRHLAQYEQAETILQRTLDLSVQLYGESADETSMARNQLGIVYKYIGEFDKGEGLYREALKNLIANNGELNSKVAVLYHNLGGLFHASGDFAKAEPYALKAWEINREAIGDDSPVTMSDAAAYAGVLDGLKRYDESEPIYRDALELFEKIYGAEHYELAVNLNNLANVRFAKGDVEEAEVLLRRALAMKEKLLGAEHPDTALSANNLGMLLKKLKRTDEAFDLIRRALIVFESQLGEDHPKTLMARKNLTSTE